MREEPKLPHYAKKLLAKLQAGRKLCRTVADTDEAMTKGGGICISPRQITARPRRHRASCSSTAAPSSLRMMACLLTLHKRSWWPDMRKPTTAKDVLYALEYLGARLVLHPGKKWRLEPEGIAVTPHVADEAKAHGGVVGQPDHSGLAVYVWSHAA